MNSPGNNERSRPLKAETTLVTAGPRQPRLRKGFVNPPVVHGSTVLLSDGQGSARPSRRVSSMAATAHPTTKALQEALMALEGPAMRGASVLRPPACRRSPPPLLAVLNAGDHLPGLRQCLPSQPQFFVVACLPAYGVETTLFSIPWSAPVSPGCSGPTTKAVLVEAAPARSPSKCPTFPAIATVAHAARGRW